MSIKDDYQQAVALAKQGNYEQARSLLIAYDHPKTNALLDKVNAAIAAGTTTSDDNAPKTFVTRIILSALLVPLLFLPGLLATIYFSKQARKYPHVPGARAMIWFNRILFVMLALIPVWLVLSVMLGIMQL